MADEPNYVTRSTWVRQVGRPDLVDEVADTFERPAATLETALDTTPRDPAWPRRSRGWRPAERLHPPRAREGAAD